MKSPTFAKKLAPLGFRVFLDPQCNQMHMRPPGDLFSVYVNVTAVDQASLELAFFICLMISHVLIIPSHATLYAGRDLYNSSPVSSQLKV